MTPQISVLIFYDIITLNNLKSLNKILNMNKVIISISGALCAKPDADTECPDTL